MSLKKLFSREYSVQYAQCSMQSIGPAMEEQIPIVLKSLCYLPENKNEVACAQKDDWNHFVRIVEQAFFGTEKLHEFIGLFHHFGQNYVAASQKIAAFPLASVTDEQLLSMYHSYLEILNIYSAYLWFGYVLNDLFAKKGEECLIEKKLSADIKEALFSPCEKTGILELSELLQSSLANELYAKIADEFAWMSCLDIHNDPWTQEDVASFALHLPPKKETMTFLLAAEKACLTLGELELFSHIRELAYIKDMRDVYRRKGVFFIQKLFDEIGRRMQMTRKEVAYMTCEEIKQGLQGMQIHREHIEERKTGFLIYWDNEKIAVSCDSKKIAEFKDQLDTVILQKQIKGVVASQGFAQGTVKVVLGVSDLAKVETGDIMIAVTTHPDFVPAMQKAAAIITEEGGMTSHAAIISRELKIPCIVSALNATSVFKDGDVVKVDAVDGFIKKFD